MKEKTKEILVFLQRPHVVLALYVTLALAASAQSWLLTRSEAAGENPQVTRYNNYVIFKYSHLHLLDGKDLFNAHPDEYWDLYKYSPTFALFFGLFAWFPDWLGLALWNLLNVVVFFLAIRLLPFIEEKKKALILLFSAADMMTSLQNSQSNSLVAGLLILGLAFFERKNHFMATLCIVATFYIKIFGIVTLLLLLFYPEKRKSILYAALWMILLWVVPVVVTGFAPLLRYYAAYLDMLKNDQSVSFGISVMGWLYTWFGLAVSKTLIALAGFALMCVSLIRIKSFSNHVYRYLFFSALLVWMVIFNHKAESPTFIIATAGVFIWFFTRGNSISGRVVLISVLVFTSLSATDLFPPAIREGFFEPYAIKAVPCILAWVMILVDLWRPSPRLPG